MRNVQFNATYSKLFFLSLNFRAIRLFEILLISLKTRIILCKFRQDLHNLHINGRYTGQGETNIEGNSPACPELYPNGIFHSTFVKDDPVAASICDHKPIPPVSG
jgi:hypothetical protein